MRRLLTVCLVIGVVAIGGAPAFAKGIAEHAKVTISGAGLPGGIVTLGDDGTAFALGAEPWAEKWDAPNIGGSLEPTANLGRAFVVRVVLGCENGERGRYRQMLYPDAPGGPQVFTPAGTLVCGDRVPAGYDGLGPALTALLESHGVEAHPSATPSTAASGSSSDRSTPALAVIGAPLVLLAVVSEEILRRRRRRR